MAPPAADGGARELRSAFIDLLRGLAILGVVFTHVLGGVVDAAAARINLGGAPVSVAFFNHGFLGVNLFFVLSGYVLFRPGTMDDRRGIVAYYRARALRLWPMLFIFVVFLNVTGRASAPTFAYSILTNLGGLNSLACCWTMTNPAGTLGVIWSLGVEIMFSVLVPVLLFIGFGWGAALLAISSPRRSD